MKRRTHQIAITCARPRDVTVHGARDRIVFSQVCVRGCLARRKTFGFVIRDGAWALGA
jgi:hypothetical protein